MSLFNFSQEELLTFFVVLVRFGTLVAVLPFIGDKFVPLPAKVLFALVVTVALFPTLVKTGQVRPGDALVWGATAAGVVGTVGLEALFGLALGFTAKILFDAIHFGGNLAGHFMGFAMASFYDPHHEAQTEVVAEIQMALAMLVFLALDGHHLLLRSALESYAIVGIGKAGLGAAFGQKLVEFSSQIFSFGLQIAAPVAVALFAVNVGFGIIARALPQINVLVLSFSVSALVGLIVMFLSVPEFQLVAGNLLSRVDDWMNTMIYAMRT